MPDVRTFVGTDPEYETLDYLGSGAFGRVIKVRKKADGRVYACKSIDVSSGNEFLIRAIQREVQVLRELRGCRNVVKWHDDISFNEQRQTIHLHMDFYSDGDLKNRIDRYAALGKTFTDDFAVSIFWDILNALEDVHAKGIVHRDIKPANILLNGDTAYLADFGLGKFSSGIGGSIGTVGSGEMGTPAFMAPENFGPFPKYGPKTDIFALGCVMYQLCELRLPFRSADRSVIPPMTSQHHPGLKNVIQRCMDLDVNSRPNTATIITISRQYLPDCAPRTVNVNTKTSVSELLALLSGKSDATSSKSTSNSTTTSPSATNNSPVTTNSKGNVVSSSSTANTTTTSPKTKDNLATNLFFLFSRAMIATMIGPEYTLWMNLLFMVVDLSGAYRRGAGSWAYFISSLGRAIVPWWLYAHWGIDWFGIYTVAHAILLCLLYSRLAEEVA